MNGVYKLCKRFIFHIGNGYQYQLPPHCCLNSGDSLGHVWHQLREAPLKLVPVRGEVGVSLLARMVLGNFLDALASHELDMPLTGSTIFVRYQ